MYRKGWAIKMVKKNTGIDQMNDDELTLLAIKGVLSELSPADKQKAEKLIADIRQLMANAGSPAAELAIALLGAELQMQS